MSLYYEEYKVHDGIINGLNVLLEKVHNFGYVWSSTGTLPMTYLSTDIPEAFKDLINYIDSGECGWKGEDADACLNKIKNMKSKSVSFQGELRRAVMAIEECIKEERTKHTHACVRAMDNFTEADWVVCALEYPDKWLGRK